jgi:hypothetical protein
MRQDPTALNRSPRDSPSAQKRSASLPINEFNRALRSHSTVLEDFPLKETSNRVSTQLEGHVRPRRATTPSRLWTPNKTPGFVDWTGLSPRPASTQARDSKFISDSEIDGAVGIAVTSGSHPNRRSRSLGELRGAVPQNIIIRRRSDEIKYWRESYDPGLLSPLSSTKADAEEPIQLDRPELPLENLPQEQPQPFNFGPMGEMAGMKITQAASLETRVQRLEHRVHQVERGIVQIHRGTSREPLLFHSSPKRNSRDRSGSTNRPRTDCSDVTLTKQQMHREQPGSEPYGRQNRSSSYGSSRPSTNSVENSYTPSFDNFSHPNLLPSEEHETLASHHATARPLSTSTTIRGLSPTLSKDSHLTGEHWTALTNMLLAEQAARQHLEALVHDLQQQIHAMRSSNLSNGVSYPTPESDHLADPIKNEVGGQSSFEADDSSDDEGRYAQEEFQTPNEENGHLSDDIFGDAKVASAKNTPRTLSLSQLTLGKGITHSVNF